MTFNRLAKGARGLVIASVTHAHPRTPLALRLNAI